MLSREVQDDFRRRSITGALAAECASRGYGATTIGHLCARAGCARNTIYELFSNKESIFLALLEGAIAELGERIDRACREAGPQRRERLEAALAAVLDWVALDPPAAHALLVDAPTAGDAAFALKLEMQADFTERLKRLAPLDPRRPPLVEQLLVDGTASIVCCLVVAGEAVRAPSLLPSLAVFLEQPLLGDSADWAAAADSS
jgi:AcrR family transcriptional regulator